MKGTGSSHLYSRVFSCIVWPVRKEVHVMFPQELEKWDLSEMLLVYMHIYIYMCMYVCIYIYICIYVYIYVCM